MNQFFQLYSGSIALLTSIITSIIIARKWRHNRNISTRRHLLPVLYWSPIFLISCMVLHIINNGLNTISMVSAGTAKFNFYQYSYQLFGVVLAYQSYLLLLNCKKHAEGNLRFNRSLYASMALIIFTTLPTFIFTPIGIVPSVVMVIHFVVSVFVHKPIAVATVKTESVEFIYLDEEQGVLI